MAIRILQPGSGREEKPARVQEEKKHKGENRTGVGTGVEAVLAEIDALIGLHKVKKLVREIYAWALINRRRREMGLAAEPHALHMIFRGNPGTGKTTVARLLGKFFRKAGLLPRGHLLEVERADLVGEYVGHTAQKTREVVRKALGGILFIDEAYSLARGGEKDFGKEAIDVLVKAMEDHKEELVLILAGYRDEMDYFLLTNPGLKSRFPIQLDFPDYTLRELLAIGELMVEQKQYCLAPDAREELKRLLTLGTGGGREREGNARLVRNLIEKAIRSQALRLMEKKDLSREDLMLITREDIARGREMVGG